MTKSEIKKALAMLRKRGRRLQRIKEKVIKKYWEKIKDRPKYKDPNWHWK